MQQAMVDDFLWVRLAGWTLANAAEEPTAEQSRSASLGNLLRRANAILPRPRSLVE